MQSSAEIAESAPKAANSRVLHTAPKVWVRSWHELWRSASPSLRFLFQTEVHVYSFAVAANLLLSFFPFLAAMILMCRSLFHWKAAVEVIILTVTGYFPDTFGVDFRAYLLAASYRKFSWLSIFLLLFTANGIFVPLEVALNRIWRVRKNRSFLRNQILSLALIFICGVLVLGSVSLTALNTQYLEAAFGIGRVSTVLRLIAFKAAALALTMAVIFVLYWLLPNAKIPVRRLIPASIAVAGLLEILKYVNLLTWPWLRAKLQHEVPPFVQSISIILWSFVATLILLAGAEWSARVTLDRPAAPERKPPIPALVN